MTCLRGGTFDTTLNLNSYNPTSTWGMEREQLLVYCNVTEFFTDEHVSGQATAKFARTQFHANYDRSAPFFHPNLSYVFQVNATFNVHVLL